MSSKEETLQTLQVELSDKLEALKNQGLNEAEQQEATTALLLEFGAKLQAATLAISQATASSSSSSSSSSAAHTTTIYAEQAEKFSLKSTKNEDLQLFGEKLKAKAVQTGRNASEAQLRSMTTEKERAVIMLAFRNFRFPDGGESIEDADNWLKWDNNEKLCEILKLVFPKTDAQSDSQKLLNLMDSFKIHASKHNQHFLSFVADMILALHFDERIEEFNNLNAQAFTLLKDIIVNQVMGRKAASCEVTKQLVADINARAPTTLRELFDTITEEGQKLHLFSADCVRRGIPYLPFKRTEKDEKQGNEPKKTRQEGGGGSGTGEKRTQCNSCGKYHLGTCDPNRGKGGGDKSSTSSSTSSSVKTHTPGRYDKYKSQDGGKKKRKLTAFEHINDNTILQREACLNKLSESSFACQYPMKIYTSSGKYIDIIALIDTGANEGFSEDK